MNCNDIIELEVLEDETNMELDVEFKGDIIRLGSSGEFIETDPTVPDWAKQPEKPIYTASEVGALSIDDVDQALDMMSANPQSGIAIGEYVDSLWDDVINEINKLDKELTEEIAKKADTSSIPKITVDQTFNEHSENAQSGKAVAEGINLALGDIDTVLDNIIAIQESLIGGAEE